MLGLLLFAGLVCLCKTRLCVFIAIFHFCAEGKSIQSRHLVILWYTDKVLNQERRVACHLGFQYSSVCHSQVLSIN